ncbi:MAG: class I SAM-dependent methyltransferase [Actinobacteria bacterium]|nr:class I SAM-dependent methyltransferase [Actinomycetota bacterium]
MSDERAEYAARNRDAWTKSNEEYTAGRAHAAWAAEEITWGTCGAPESEVQALPDVRGLDVVELGCGTAYFGAWLKRAGARRVVGVDIAPAQLATAEEMDDEFGLGLELVEANAEATGLAPESFDVALSEYGASIWCDPYLWIPEAARLLRPGGELVFLRNSTLAILCAADDGATSETLQRPQRALHRLDWQDDGTTEFHLGHGEWVRLLRKNGFEIVDLVELYADATTPEQSYYAFSRGWAERWPWEEVWRARKSG